MKVCIINNLTPNFLKIVGTHRQKAAILTYERHFRLHVITSPIQTKMIYNKHEDDDDDENNHDYNNDNNKNDDH